MVSFCQCVIGPKSMVHVSSPLVHDGVYGEDSCCTGQRPRVNYQTR